MNPALAEWAAARRALVEQTSLSVVRIHRGRGARFSGIVWNAETLVTAAEVLHGADAVTVQTNHGSLPAEILACDLSVDVAVLRATTGAPAIAAAMPSSLTSGDELLIAGRGESAPAIVWTQVEQVGPSWRSRSGGELDRLIRLPGRLHPELEGGGVFDLDGHLCAMAVRAPRHRTLGIPSETIARVVATVLQHGRLPQPYLGVRLQPVWLDDALRRQLVRPDPDAIVVVGVEPESPAAAAGLLFGDLILSAGGRSIGTAVDLKSALSHAPLESVLAVQVYRAGARLDTRVTVRERTLG